MQNKLVCIKNVCKSFGDKNVLDCVNLTIDTGDFITLVGKSGSGKTTFLNIIGLIDKKFEGEYLFLNVNVKQTKHIVNMRSKNIGYVFQSFYLLDYLNVKENILLPFSYTNEHLDELYFETIINILDLNEIVNQKCNVLSGGEKQRVAIARALIRKPQLLICDEPTGNLDKENKERVIDVLKEVNEKFNTSILIVTHDDELAKYGKRRLLLKEKRIYESN